MFFVYILKCGDNNFYTGYTSDLEQRLKEHNKGNVISTKRRLPVTLIYYEASINQKDALHRERYLKTSWGKRYIKTRLKNYLMG
ncbi:MAG: GIY-YIG nuclease family protein [bacterium]|nr:GIY-YIG nuclease family protein [bacterium]